METLKTLFSEFWSPFIGAGIGGSVVWFLSRSMPDGRMPFLSPKSFVELAGYSKEEQKHLLHKASAEAFRHWQSFLPVVVLVFFFAAGAAFAHTLPKITTIPNSWWVRMLVVMVFAALGGWLAGSMTTRYVRPFLRTIIERPPDAA
jgi:hypothetical protein